MIWSSNLRRALHDFERTRGYESLCGACELLETIGDERSRNYASTDCLTADDAEALRRCLALAASEDVGACARLLRCVARGAPELLVAIDLEVHCSVVLSYLENASRSTSAWCTSAEEAPGLDPIALECALLWTRALPTLLPRAPEAARRALRVALWRPWRSVVASDSAVCFVIDCCNIGYEGFALETLEFLRWSLRIENCHAWSSDPWLRAHAFAVAHRAPFGLFRACDPELEVVKGLLHQATCESWSHACSSSSSSNEFVVVEDLSANVASEVWQQSLDFIAATLLHAPSDVTLKKPETCSAIGNALVHGLESSLESVQLRATQIFRYWADELRDLRLGRLRCTWSERSEQESVEGRRRGREVLVRAAAGDGLTLLSEPRVESTNSLSPWLSRIMPRLCAELEEDTQRPLDRPPISSAPPLSNAMLSPQTSGSRAPRPQQVNNAHVATPEEVRSNRAPGTLKRARPDEQAFEERDEDGLEMASASDAPLRSERLKCLGSLALAAARDMHGTITLSTWDLVRIVLMEASARQRTLGSSPMKRTRLHCSEQLPPSWAEALNACSSHFLRLRAEGDAPVWVGPTERQYVMRLLLLLRESLVSVKGDATAWTDAVAPELACFTHALALSSEDEESRRRLLPHVMEVLDSVLSSPRLMYFDAGAWEATELVLVRLEELALLALRLFRSAGDETGASQLVQQFRVWYASSEVASAMGWFYHSSLGHPPEDVRILSMMRRSLDICRMMDSGEKWSGLSRALKFARHTFASNPQFPTQELLTGAREHVVLSLAEAAVAPERLLLILESLALAAASLPWNTLGLAFYSPLWQALTTHLEPQALSDAMESSHVLESLVRTKASSTWAILNSTIP